VQPLVHGPAAALKAFHDVIEGKRFLGAEEQAVNLPHGTRNGKARRRIGKEVHARALECIHSIRGLRRFLFSHNRMLLNKLPTLVKMRFLPRLGMKMELFCLISRKVIRHSHVLGGIQEKANN
jgi:hypothetical protein